ncbi:hypothetical protein ACFE04_005994 [Oxalis oulophora]
MATTGVTAVVINAKSSFFPNPNKPNRLIHTSPSPPSLSFPLKKALTSPLKSSLDLNNPPSGPTITMDPTISTSTTTLSLKSRLKNNETLYGIFLLSFSPTLAEIAGLAGYDFAVIDMEHGPGGITDALNCLRALAATQTPAIIRLPDSCPTWAKKALDLGPQGIMFPMIESAKDAKKAVSYCRFPPAGIRGSAHTVVRASSYGIDEGYLSHYEDELLIMCQVESEDGVKKIEEIAAVEGVDCIQTGPLDLSASMGYLWDPGNKKVREKLRAAEKAVLGSSKAFLSGFAMPHDKPDDLRKRGYHMVSGTVDIGLFRNAAVADVEKFKMSLAVESDTFESWLVAEHFKRGFDQQWLSGTFSKAIFLGNGLVAIFAGLFGNILVDTFALGPVAPFDAAACILAIGMAIILSSWTENFGDPSENKDLLTQFKGAAIAIASDEKIALLGAIQSLFEGSMYTFVFLWTPALSPNDEEIPHGFIFATFMLASMLGSSIAARLLARSAPKVESYMQIVFIVSSACLLMPILTNFLVGPAGGKSAGLSFAGCLQLLGFCAFEGCVGIFWPSIMKMRSQYIPEEARSTIMNFFRIPLNIFVCVVLYNVNAFPITIMFGMCSIFLFVASILQRRLMVIAESEKIKSQDWTAMEERDPEAEPLNE